MPAGRPTIYTPELGAEICKRIAEGESLRAICDGPPRYDPLVDEDRHSHMPAVSTVLDWALDISHEFCSQYEQARTKQMEYFGDKLQEWPDEYSEVARARLKSDNVKWLMARLASRRYGDRIQTDVTTDGESLSMDSVGHLGSVLGAALRAAKQQPDDEDEDDLT